MDINARILELALIRADGNQNQHNLSAMMRTLVDEVLTHAKNECHAIRCDCGEVAIDAMRMAMWKAERDRANAR